MNTELTEEHIGKMITVWDREGDRRVEREFLGIYKDGRVCCRNVPHGGKVTMWRYGQPIQTEPERIPLGPEDIKQGDVVRWIGDMEYEWHYIEPYNSDEVKKVRTAGLVSFTHLMERYKIRSIGETEWRPCWKEK